MQEIGNRQYFETVIELRSNLIKERFRRSRAEQKLNDLNNLLKTSEDALLEVMHHLKGSGAYTPGAFAYHAAYKAININNTIAGGRSGKPKSDNID